MPSYNLTVSPSPTVGVKTVFMGLLCTLPTQALSFADSENVGAVCTQKTPSKKVTMKKPPRINDMTALNEILKKEPGTVCVLKQTSTEALSRVRDLAIQSNPAIAEQIKLLEAQGIKYVIEIRKKSDSMKGSEDGALGVWDATGKDSLSDFNSGNKDTTTKHVQEFMSPVASDLLEIIEQLETRGHIASSSPEESPDVPDTIAPGDHVAICGALGLVSKPKAAALFSYLKRLRKSLEFVDYEAIADEEQLASIKDFLNVDYHIIKAIQNEGHPLGAHGNMDTEECDKIMTSTFDRYFKECWPHISAVLQGGGQEESIKGLEGMATDISNWRDPTQELDPQGAQAIQEFKKIVPVNSLWYLVGMLAFLQGASSEEWKLYPVTQDIWTNGFCPNLQPDYTEAWVATLKGDLMLCLPANPIIDDTDILEDREEELQDIAVRQTFGSLQTFLDDQQRCESSWDKIRKNARQNDIFTIKRYFYYTEDGDPVINFWRQSKAIGKAKASGVDVRCRRAFKARWYDATDQVIKKLCSRVLDRTVKKLDDNEQQPWDHLLLEKYHFTLTTHYQGPNFKSSTVNSNYEGFVTCSETPTLTDEEALNRFESIGSVKEGRKDQKLCTKKLWRGEPRPILVFHTSLDIDQDGRISIQSRDHSGNIGSCEPFLREEVEAIKSRRRAQHADNVTPSALREEVEAVKSRQQTQHADNVTPSTNFVSNGTQSTALVSSVTENTKPMSGKLIRKLADGYVKEREGLTESTTPMSGKETTKLVSNVTESTKLMTGKETTKLVSNVTESTKLMTGEEIRKLVDAFAEEREKGLTQSPGPYSNSPYQWNGTDSFNLTQTPLVSVAGAGLATGAEPNSMTTYLPYVGGIVGGIGALVAAGTAWKCFKRRSGEAHEEHEDYEAVPTSAV